MSYDWQKSNLILLKIISFTQAIIMLTKQFSVKSRAVALWISPPHYFGELSVLNYHGNIDQIFLGGKSRAVVK